MSIDKKEYSISLTKEELDAVSVLVNMAFTYTWDLYHKNEDSDFYVQHKENIDLIKNYHDKGYQGIIAVGGNISEKCKESMKGEEPVPEEEMNIPLGIKPKDIWQTIRLHDLKEAINRYIAADYKIPKEWINEYNELGLEVNQK